MKALSQHAHTYAQPGVRTHTHSSGHSVIRVVRTACNECVIRWSHAHSPTNLNPTWTLLVSQNVNKCWYWFHVHQTAQRCRQSAGWMLAKLEPIKLWMLTLLNPLKTILGVWRASVNHVGLNIMVKLWHYLWPVRGAETSSKHHSCVYCTFICKLD